MRLSGTARFFPLDGALLFEERGVMTLGGYLGEAIRRYVFRFTDAGTALVSFEDGRPFHHLELRNGSACVRHDCEPDLYEGRYRLLGPDQWLLSWRITGPRKQQLITSRYRRKAEPGRIA
jgi:Family of unknown function (DUF6314)